MYSARFYLSGDKMTVKYLSFAALAGLAACATPVVYNPILPHDGVMNPVDTLVVSASGTDEPAVALDMPVDYGAIQNQANVAAYSNPSVSPGAGAAGGLVAVLIIAAVDASIDAHRNGRVNDLLDEAGFDAEGVFNTALEDALTERGYTILTKQDTGETGEADAVFTVSVDGYGYQLASVTGWVPMVNLSVNMTSPSGDVLIADRVRVGQPSQASSLNPYLVPPEIRIALNDERYYFETVDELVEETPEIALRGLEFSLEQAAIAAADLVARD